MHFLLVRGTTIQLEKREAHKSYLKIKKLHDTTEMGFLILCSAFVSRRKVGRGEGTHSDLDAGPGELSIITKACSVSNENSSAAFAC